MSRHSKRQVASLSAEALLERSAWFGVISSTAREQVRATVLERLVAAGESLSHQGEMQHHWIGVLEGLLTWSIVTHDGRLVSFSGQAPGTWFGEGTLLRKQPRRSELIALRETRVLLVPGDVFHWLHQTEPAFTNFLLLQINERLHWFMGHLAAFGLLDADRLVARALANLVHPLLNPMGVHYLQLTQDELASLAMVSRPRCNKSLGSLQRRGIVKLDYGAVTVLDVPALQSFALE